MTTEASREAMRIAIATAVGFSKIIKSSDHEGMLGEKFPLRGWLNIPNYPQDHDAISEALASLLTEKVQQALFGERLAEVLNAKHRGESRWLGPTTFYYATATAAELCEALVKTLNLPTHEKHD